MRPIDLAHRELRESHAEAPAGELSIAHVAHELNSLLDGSMRSISLAQRSLRLSRPADDARDSNVDERLQAAQDALRQISSLLHRAMDASEATLNLFQVDEAIGRQVQQIIATLTPLADEHKVAMHVDLTPRAASLPARTLGPVILNGLRNAIESCATGPAANRRVELSIVVNAQEELMIVICDNGPGAMPDSHRRTRKPGGHGFGLDLAGRIVATLEGEIRLTNVPFGAGAVLQVVLPLRNMVQHG